MPPRLPFVQTRRLFRIRRGATPDSADSNWNGQHTWITPEDLAQADGSFIANTRRQLSDKGLASCSASLAQPGSLVLSSRAPIGYIAQTKTWSCTNQGCFSLEPLTDLDSRYFRYQFLGRRPDLQALGLGSTFMELSTDALASFQLASPPLVTQRAVADFLDRETARIDILVAMRNRLSQLLAERARSVTEDTLAQVRERTAPSPLGHLVVEVSHRLGAAEPPPLLSVSIHAGVIPFEEANPDRVPRANELTNYKRCTPGDIIVNRMRAFQGAIGVANRSGIVSSDYAVLRPRSTASSRFLHYLMRSPWFVGEMEARLRGIGNPEVGVVRTPRVNWEDLRRILVPLPSMGEQQKIVGRLDDVLGAMEAARRAINQQLSLLRERRQVLITASVNGRIDVAA